MAGKARTVFQREGAVASEPSAPSPTDLPVADSDADGIDDQPDDKVREIGGPKGPEPTRYGDWEKGGRCSDF